MVGIGAPLLRQGDGPVITGLLRRRLQRPGGDPGKGMPPPDSARDAGDCLHPQVATADMRQLVHEHRVAARILPAEAGGKQQDRPPPPRQHRNDDRRRLRRGRRAGQAHSGRPVGDSLAHGRVSDRRARAEEVPHCPEGPDDPRTARQQTCRPEEQQGTQG